MGDTRGCEGHTGLLGSVRSSRVDHREQGRVLCFASLVLRENLGPAELVFSGAQRAPTAVLLRGHKSGIKAALGQL